MTNATYLSNRKKYGRAQGMLWSHSLGEEVDGFYLPEGYEFGAQVPVDADPSLINNFLVLSDHNRSPIEFSSDRIQKRQRMVNGRLRSHHIADKLNISVSWNNLPSRSFRPGVGNFDEDGFPVIASSTDQFTVDGGAGGLEMLRWYRETPGSFWVYLAYDAGPYDMFRYKYSEIIEMTFKDFSYDVVKRGQTTHDLWNISISLEEV